ncbi:hypothetical protein B0T37_19650 [Chromobacterium violaceum]|nr:hypothetical protein B0T37_19650 [Chromobacterium violaceum]
MGWPLCYCIGPNLTRSGALQKHANKHFRSIKLYLLFFQALSIEDWSMKYFPSFVLLFLTKQFGPTVYLSLEVKFMLDQQ